MEMQQNQNLSTLKKCAIVYKHECKKFFKSFLFWCVLCLVVVIVVALVFQHSYFSRPIDFLGDMKFGDDWRQVLEGMLADANGDTKAVINWYLDNNIKPYSQGSLSQYLISDNMLIFLSMLAFVSYVVCNIVCQDISKPTALSNNSLPLRRYQVLLCKVAFVATIAVGFALLIFIVTIVSGWLILGFDNFSSVSLQIQDGAIIAMPVYLTGLIVCLLNCVTFVFVGLFAILLSTIIKYDFPSAALNFVLTYSLMAVAFLVMFVYDVHWVEFLPFIHVALSTIFIDPSSMGNRMFDGIGFSFAILAFWSVVIVLLSIYFNGVKLKKLNSKKQVTI
ncbi:MAG: hypothetical protein FWF56_02270 [Firmicutes bacterium]|nr:hypothetical protein [Bacillota bacterium]MCL1953828.1 hypothetical protein [Bacillota bacterium]